MNGIQNGGSTATDADGVALVNPAGTVIEVLSYEGTFSATDGPAMGLTATDIGVRELGNEPVGQSLQRSGSGTWTGPKTATFGVCNDDDEPPPPAEVVSVSVAPASATVTVGATKVLTATARDANNQPISVAVTWSTADPAVATVNASGLVTGAGVGTTTITATAPNGVHGESTLTVEDAPPPPDVPEVRISELHYDNFGTDVGEAVEIEGPAGTDLAGWSVVLYNGNGGVGVPYNTRALSGVLPATCGTRGVLYITYPQDGLQNGSPDGLALVDPAGTVVELLSYEGTFTATDGPAAGKLSIDLGASQNSTAVGQTLQRDASNVWKLAAAGFGVCTGQTPLPPPNTLSFSGRTPTDPPLPIGFQDQLFATLRDASNVVIPTTITWTSETPAIASIDERGVMTALAEGTAVLRATATEGTSATFALPTRVAQPSATAVYAGNAAFGEPADADASDDFIVRHAQYTSSYNVNRATPNWVAYEIDASHFGQEDRCDCFTFDPALPPSFPRYTTADYTGAAAINGFAIDRGHLTRSFDRTAGSLDNAFTFYFSNVVPQAADLNQGPWAAFESYLGDLARFSSKEVYIITGVSGYKGTLKNEGKIVIPARTWKVAVIMPKDQGLADVHDYTDLEVIAVDMPNDAGIKNESWQKYVTTVDAVELSSGYDLLALLSDETEVAVEANIKPPLASLATTVAATDEGGEIALDASGSSDPNGTIVDYTWDFGDGGLASGPTVSHVYTQDGVYTVTLVVTDNDGLTATITATATVTNVAPIVDDFAGVDYLLPGETYRSSGTFFDPGADLFTGVADFGDGTAVVELALEAQTFTLEHTYEEAGTFVVTVSIADDDTFGAVAASVVVATPQQAVGDIFTMVDLAMRRGAISAGNAMSLMYKLGAADQYLENGDYASARDVLTSFVSQVNALVRAGKFKASEAVPIRTLALRVIRSLS